MTQNGFVTQTVTVLRKRIRSFFLIFIDYIAYPNFHVSEDEIDPKAYDFSFMHLFQLHISYHIPFPISDRNFKTLSLVQS